MPSLENFGRGVVVGLSASFLSTHVSLHELGEVGIPDVIDMGPLKQRHAPLICLHTRVKNKNNQGYKIHEI